MRTTINLDDDVLDRARRLAESRRTPFRQVVNAALRAGLEQVEKPARQRGYRTRPHAMGMRPGYDVDNVQELLARIDGENSR